MTPETSYAKSGGVNVAYQVTGYGDVDLLFVPGWVSHIEHAWEEPSFAPFLERMASFSRLILMDRRGTGLSDPVEHLPTLEERMDDVRAVLDAAGSERAFLMGISESGPMCTLFAASYPERTAGLILCNTFARDRLAEVRPPAKREKLLRGYQAWIEENWGTGVTAKMFARSRAGDEAFVASWGRFERRAVSPGGMKKIIEMSMDTDVRHVLSSIRVPTVVIHREEDPLPIALGRYLADHIPGARWVPVPGVDHFPWIGDTAPILDELEHFVTGTRKEIEPDRILATLLFVDIVDSTRELAARGDRGWADLLSRFYGVIRRELERFHGQEIDSAGDGLFATFDGPARGIRCAWAVRQAVAPLGIRIRAGLHTGECERMGDKVGGIAVHLGARVCGAAGPDEVWVSSTVKDLVAGSGLRFAERGTHELKGVPGSWSLYAVTEGEARP